MVALQTGFRSCASNFSGHSRLGRPRRTLSGLRRVRHTGRLPKVLGLIAILAAGGCQTQTQIVADEQSVAMQTALRRARFEMACPAAVGTILSRNLLQPVLYGGLGRAGSTIGVAGCGKRAVYISVCQLGSVACFAASSPPNRFGTT